MTRFKVAEKAKKEEAKEKKKAQVLPKDQNTKKKAIGIAVKLIGFIAAVIFIRKVSKWVLALTGSIGFVGYSLKDTFLGKMVISKVKKQCKKGVEKVQELFGKAEENTEAREAASDVAGSVKENVSNVYETAKNLFTGTNETEKGEELNNNQEI